MVIRVSYTNVCILRRSHRLAGETAMATTLAERIETDGSTEARPRSAPPGPPLPKLLQTLLVWSTPERFLGGCSLCHGHTFSVTTVEIRPLVYITREGDVTAVETLGIDVLHAGEGNAIL